MKHPSLSLLIFSLSAHMACADQQFLMSRHDSFNFNIPDKADLVSVRSEEVAPIEAHVEVAPVQPEDPFASIQKNFLGYIFERNFNRAMLGQDVDKDKYLTFMQKTKDKKIIGKIKQQYENYVDNIEELYSFEPRIPKIIHQIWVGPHPFPGDAIEWQASWKKFHPDWEYKLWTNAEVETLEFENKRYYNEATNWGEKADILRLELIYQFGGLYVDIDQKCYKPFDVLHHTCDFYAGIHQLCLIFGRKDRLRVANGVFAAAPGHPILKHAVEQVKNNRHHTALLKRAGPDFVTNMIKELYDVSRSLGYMDVILPANYFYPYGERDKKFKMKPTAKIYVKPETMAVHYYTSYWVTPPTKKII